MEAAFAAPPETDPAVEALLAFAVPGGRDEGAPASGAAGQEGRDGEVHVESAPVPGGLFDEHLFTPVTPAVPARRAKHRSHFRFTDTGEARLFLHLTVATNVILLFGLTNFFTVNNPVTGITCFVAGTGAGLWHLRLWLRLCGRAYPRVSRWNTFTPGLGNPATRQCLAQARDLLRSG
jgi:hypothetical protein